MQQMSFLDAPTRGEHPIPEDAEPCQCKSCGASIVWGVTGRGNPVPLDLACVRVVGNQRYALNHFATCPQGREWRKD